MNKQTRRAMYIFTGLVSIGVIYMLYNYIGAFVASIFVYYSVRPVYKKLRERGINNSVAAVISPVLFLIPIFLLVLYTMRTLIIEIQSFGSRLSIPVGEFVNIRAFDFLPTTEQSSMEITDLVMYAINNSQQIIESYPNLFDTLLSAIFSLSDIFFNLFIICALTFYFLRDGDKIKKTVLKLCSYDPTVTEYMRQMDEDFSVVFYGNILLAIIASAVGAIVFSFISSTFPGGDALFYPVLIGFLCGITSLIPIVGVKLVYIPVTIMLLINNWLIYDSTIQIVLFPMLFLITAFIIVDTIPDLIGRPYLGSRGGVSTGILVLSYTLGPLTFGWYGLFLGPILFVPAYRYYSMILPKIRAAY